MDRQDHRLRYEIDHTLLDVLAKDRRAPEGYSASELIHPQLALRIERESRLIVAAFLSHERPEVHKTTSQVDEKLAENIEPP